LMPSSDRFDTLGSKLGPKIARLISEAIVATKRALGPHEHAIRVQASQDIINRAGHEVADLYRPLIAAVLADPDAKMHPHVREFLGKVVSGEHQWHALAGALGTLGQSALSQAIGNAVAPLTYHINALGPNLDLDPQTAAQAVAAGIVALADGQSSARQQGYDAGEFQTLTELAQSIPGATDLFDLRNRGIISDSDVIRWLTRGAVPPELREKILQLRFAVLPADLAALAVLRSVISQAEGERIAALSGVSASDFQIMIDDTGEPPGLEQLEEAYRRGFIDQARLHRGILQSRIRNEWIDVIDALRFSPISVADAVNGVVQNHLTAEQAASIAEQNGLEPGWVNTFIATAGEPLSRTEMEQLYNRGLVTKDDVLQALRESRLKDKYGNDAFELHVRLLEPRMLSSAVEFGAISHADAVKRAMEYGFSAADAGILVNEGSARKLQTYRQRVVSAAEGLYEQNAISDAQFRQVAISMGFDHAEADFVVSSADYRRKEKTLTSVVAAIRSKYVGHHIEQGTASSLLDAAGIPADRRDFLLKSWNIEEAANVRKLTEAQVIKAFKDKLITAEQANTRLLDMGFPQEDAILLLEGA
jgi:hypothetical protein